MHILVVEDNEGDQFLSKMAILSVIPGATVHMARDGVEALQFLKDTNVPLNLILLDINMPRMNGHEFLKKYSELTDSEIPVIAMLTSSSQDRDINAVSLYKCVKDYILKPLEAQKIQKIIEIVEDFKK